ncbi:MAG: helix-turn-helix transcriptional regulator [Verrucomicrobiota bacterium]
MKFLNLIGPQIRRLRDNRSWTHAKLTLKLQVSGLSISRSGLSKIEARLVAVSDIKLLHLSEVLGVTVPELYPLRQKNESLKDHLKRHLGESPENVHKR